MQRVKRYGQIVLVEPYRWFFYYFFQPTQFKNKFEESSFKRLRSILRFLLPIFLVSYPIASGVRLILPFFFPHLYVYTLANGGLARFFYDTAWGTAIGLTGGILGAMAISVTVGVTLSVSIGLLGGILVDTTTAPLYALQPAIAGGIIYGILFGLLFGLTASDTQDTRVSSVLTSIFASILGCALGTVVGLSVGFPGGLLLVTLAGKDITGSDHTQSTWGAVVGAVLGVIAMVFISSIIRALSRNRAGNIIRAIAVGRLIGLAFSLLMGISGGVIGVLAISRNIANTGLQYNENLGGLIGLIAGGTFLFSYVVSYFRIPLYPANVFSSCKAYLASRRHPANVFTYLQRSSLYWDERVFLPLPWLKETLLIAAGQNLQLMLREIAFILSQRPQQTAEARQALIVLAIHDLEQRSTLPEIGQAEARLSELIPAELRQAYMRWVQALTSLSDASRSAMLSLSAIGLQARQRALDEMIISLNDVRPDVAFEDIQLNKRLSAITRQWMTAALKELGRLKAASSLRGILENPYISGDPIRLNDSSFVGRQDLVLQLEQALSNDRDRPNFLLTGERRMGKTSTLNQLPAMLSTRYIPICYDLQLRGISSSSAAFLSTISEEISLVLGARGLRIRRLSYAALQEAARQNAAVPYYLFDIWLKELGALLVPRNLTILLALDEFEKLQEATAANFLDLQLLLDWFRSVLQNRRWLALLFSGVSRPSEMGPGWAGHFVTVQTFKVSFLKREEAYRLIVSPTPDYPGELIYSKEAVEEILRVTGCHPFLVQAVCSALIEVLNSEQRKWAELPDVTEAVQQMLDGWWNTYFYDLWERTAEEQQLCLFSLQQRDNLTLSELAQQSRLEGKTVGHTLDVLLQRDLVRRDRDTYHISTPIFAEWVKRHSAF